MKTVLRILFTLIILLTLLFAGFYFWINNSEIPSYPNEAPSDFSITMDSASVAEGARMARMMCAQCHESDDGRLGGAYMPDTKEFGEIYAPNITQHSKYGITNYSNGELAFLFRTGIKKNGQFAPPWMPKYPHLSDKDLQNIIAFLRSDHYMVTPSENNPPFRKPSFIAKALSRFAFGPLEYPERSIAEPDTTDAIAFGKYISTAKFDCYSCHSADFKTLDIAQPEQSEGFMGGGNHLLRLSGEEILSPNLTMDKETGLGNWSEEQFIQSVKYGIRPFGKEAVQYPMIPYTDLTDKEISAVWAYLKSLEPIRNEKLMQDG
jgi:mono/diheme cytochrome c family protein